MTTELALSFAAVSHRRATAVIGFLAQIPGLSEGSAADADVGLRRMGRYVVMRLRFSDALVSDGILDRMQFWCARAGGHACRLEDDVGLECERRLASFDLVRRGLDATQLVETVGPLIEDLGGLPAAQETVEPHPVLHLQVYGPGWEGVGYDPRTRSLFIPTPLAPPAGDRIIVQLETVAPVREVARATARIADAEQDGRGGIAGFTALLDADSNAAQRVLTVTSARRSYPACARSEQRFPVAGRIAVGGRNAAMVNLSRGGAFLRTRELHPVGGDVDVELRLPNDMTIQTSATVVHARPDGVGVRFKLGPDDEAALASAVTSMAGRSRRVLIVDDDALTRSVLGAAFEARGYEVLTAPDAAHAMHTLADQVLTLDLLLTDVLMPGVDGEQLVRSIRQIGGESELPIVAVTGRVDPELERRLAAAGADAVLDKSVGAAAIVCGAERAVAMRSASTPEEGDRAMEATADDVTLA